MKENWDISTIIWIYWFQSVIIGLFNFTRILQEFSTEGFKINDNPAPPTTSTKIFTACFFLLHYGFIHIVLMAILVKHTFGYEPINITFGWGLGGIIDEKINKYMNEFQIENEKKDIKFEYILLSAAIFFINHLYSYIYNKPKETKKLNIGMLMLYPYARIIPMHIITFLGYQTNNLLIMFLICKTLADAIMHSVEHNLLQKGETN